MSPRILAAMVSCSALLAATAALAGDPVPGIDVSLEQIPGGKVIAQTQTDRSGAYQFRDVAPGSYCVKTALISTSTLTPSRSAVEPEAGLMLANLTAERDSARLIRVAKFAIGKSNTSLSVTVGTSAQPTTTQPLTTAPTQVKNCFTISGRGPQTVKGVVQISIKEEGVN